MECCNIAKELDLPSIKQSWYIQPCSALHDKGGIYDGLQWIQNNTD